MAELADQEGFGAARRGRIGAREELSQEPVHEASVHFGGRLRHRVHNDSRAYQPRVAPRVQGLRIAFDLCSLVVLASELTVIPFIMTFSVPSDEGYFRSLTWFTAIFWTVDLLMAIHTGFHKYELTWRKISKHFRSSWLLVDSGIVVCDWVSILLTFSEDARLLKLLRFAKLSRVFRVVGVLRVAKMLQIYEESSRFASGAILAVIRFLGMVFLFLWVNHCLSCVFYLFGKLEDTDTEVTWLGTTIEIGGELVMYRELNMWYLYWTSFHWCIISDHVGCHRAGGCQHC